MNLSLIDKRLKDLESKYGSLNNQSSFSNDSMINGDALNKILSDYVKKSEFGDLYKKAS